MRDDFASERAGLNLNFANGPEAPRQNDRQFTPSTGTPPEPGKPFVLAAVGDGASGETNADSVRDLIQSWDPNLFLYFGDVYETGTVAEFHNWGRQYFGGLRDIRNPIVGDHEYEGGDGARNYFDFWDNIPHYYSYDAAGWHFIALDSSVDLGGSRLARRSSSGCAATSGSSEAACTIAYMHMPRFNIGKSGEIKRLNDVWRLLSDHGVELLMAGHDHTYQRWRPVDANGELASSDGMTQFIVGNGARLRAVRAQRRAGGRLVHRLRRPADGAQFARGGLPVHHPGRCHARLGIGAVRRRAGRHGPRRLDRAQCDGPAGRVGDPALLERRKRQRRGDWLRNLP